MLKACLAFNWFEKQTRIIYKGNLTKGTQLCKSQSLSMNVNVKLMKESKACPQVGCKSEGYQVRLHSFQDGRHHFILVLASPDTILLRVVRCFTLTRGFRVDGHHPLKALHSKLTRMRERQQCVLQGICGIFH